MGDERSARIERQHSQEMALRYLALLGNTPVPLQVVRWTDFFQRDLQNAVDVSNMAAVSTDTEKPIESYETSQHEEAMIADTVEKLVGTFNPVNHKMEKLKEELSPKQIDERFDREIPPHATTNTTTPLPSPTSSEFKELLIRQLVKRMAALPKESKKDIKARLVSLGVQNPTTPEETFRQLDSQKLIYMESFISDLLTKVNP